MELIKKTTHNRSRIARNGFPHAIIDRSELAVNWSGAGASDWTSGSTKNYHGLTNPLPTSPLPTFPRSFLC